MKRAFESDWAHSHIESLCSNSTSAETVRKMVGKHYRYLHELFRYECAREDVGNDLRITLKGWTSLVKLSLATVGTNIGKNELDDIFYQSVAIGSDNHINHENAHHSKVDTAGPGLWRYQFIECIVLDQSIGHVCQNNVQLQCNANGWCLETVIKPRIYALRDRFRICV